MPDQGIWASGSPKANSTTSAPFWVYNIKKANSAEFVLLHVFPVRGAKINSTYFCVMGALVRGA